MAAEYLIYSILVGIYLMTMPPKVSGAAVPKWIDLTHEFRENETIYWPGMTKYTYTLKFSGNIQGTNVFVSYGEFAAGEHGGTHMDAPIHVIKGGKTIGEVPLESMVGDAIMVNVSAKVDKDPLYQMTVKDLEDWEKEYGRIPDDSIVLMYTGRGKYWPDEKKYLGADNATDASTWKFPGLHPDTAKWLVDNKRIKMIGLDTPSTDYSKSKIFETHRILLGNNIPQVENVANLHLLPPKGMEVIAAPMKIMKGTGGPCRIFARILHDKPASDRVVGVGYVLLVAVVFVLVICVGVYFVSYRAKPKIKV